MKRLKIGEGKISGILSIFLAVSSLLGLLCFKFPELLTTPQLREVYSANFVEKLMFFGIIASFIFALVSFLLSKKKNYATIGVALSTIAIFLGGFEVQGRAVEKTSWNLGLDWLLLDLLFMVIVFVPIELAFPKYRNQSKFHPEWKTDLIYFTISHLLVQFTAAAVRKPASFLFGNMSLAAVQEWVQALPIVFEILLALFIADVFQYWTHRFFHSNKFFWRFHSIHHSIKNIDWLAGSRLHFIDILVTRSVSFIPIYILGFTGFSFHAFLVILALHAVLVHANTRINFGLLKYLITTPQYHHWHHCKDPKYYGKNFAIMFPCIDWMFGTYYLPKNEWPKSLGLKDTAFPKGFLRQSIYPFKFNPAKKELSENEKSER